MPLGKLSVRQAANLRLALGWCLALAFSLWGAWAFWIWFLPRPDLISLVPGEPSLVIQAKNLSGALRSLRRFDHDGQLVGPRSATALALKSWAGGDMELELAGGFARDEILIALYGDGHILALSRRGAREDLADFVARRLGWSRRSAGGSRVFHLPGGKTIYYGLGRGLFMASTDEDLLRRSRDPGLAAAPALKKIASETEGDFHLRILASPHQTFVPFLGSWSARILFSPRARSPLRPGLGFWLDGLWKEEQSSLGGWPTLDRPRALRNMPASSLAVVDLGSRGILQAFGALPWKTLEKPDLSTLFPASLGLGDLEWAAALLSVDRDGIIPMPQVVFASAGGAEALDPVQENIRQALDFHAHGRLKLGQRTLRGIPIRLLDLPYTETLGPTLAALQGDLVVASSPKAMDSYLSASLGASPSLSLGRYECLGESAQAYALAHLGALSGEILALAKGLEASGLLTEEAAGRLESIVAPWLRGGRNLGAAALALRLNESGFEVRGEILGR